MTSHFLFLPGALPFSAVDRGLRGWDGLGLAEIFGQEGGFVLVEWVCLRRAVVPYCISIYSSYTSITLRGYGYHTRSDQSLVQT